jgi:hypothetical protein
MPGRSPTAASSVSITLGAPQPLFKYNSPEAMGLFNVPDMHTAILQRPDTSYGVWITGNIGPVAGAVAELSTRDFVHYENSGPGGARAEPVFAPSCRERATAARGHGRAGRRGSTGVARGGADAGDCRDNYDADYVLTYLCNEGWFFSTSTDLVTWTAPVNFLPMKMWRSCQPMDWNFMLVTPGNPAGVIGQKGYVLYAHSDAKGLDCTGRFSPHMPWIRSFTFSQK